MSSASEATLAHMLVQVDELLGMSKLELALAHVVQDVHATTRLARVYDRPLTSREHA